MFPTTINLGHPHDYIVKLAHSLIGDMAICKWLTLYLEIGMRPVRNQITNGLRKKTNTNARQKGQHKWEVKESEPGVSNSSEKIMNRQCWGSKVGHKDREQESILKQSNLQCSKYTTIEAVLLPLK